MVHPVVEGFWAELMDNLCALDRKDAPALRRPSGLRGAQELGGLANVARGHPQDGAVATGASTDGVDSRHVDLRLGKLPVQLGRRPHAVLATHKEGGLGA